MERSEIVAKMNDILRNIFGNPKLEVHDNMTAKEVPGWDSLNHINIIVSAEKVFKIKFTTKEIQNLANVGEFINLITAKL